MKKWKVIVGIALVFLLGVAAGALVTHRVYQKRFREITSGGPPAVRHFLVRVLTRQLRLTPAQQVGTDDAIHDAQKEFQVIRKEVEPRVEDILNRAKERIRQQLDVEQRAKFDQIVEQHRRRWRRDD